MQAIVETLTFPDFRERVYEVDNACVASAYLTCKKRRFDVEHTGRYCRPGDTLPAEHLGGGDIPDAPRVTAIGSIIYRVYRQNAFPDYEIGLERKREGGREVEGGCEELGAICWVKVQLTRRADSRYLERTLRLGIYSLLREQEVGTE